MTVSRSSCTKDRSISDNERNGIFRKYVLKVHKQQKNVERIISLKSNDLMKCCFRPKNREILPTRSASLEGMIMVIDDIMFQVAESHGKSFNAKSIR